MKQILTFISAIFCLFNYIIAQESDSTLTSKIFELGEVVVSSPQNNSSVVQKTNLAFQQNNISESLSGLPSVLFTNIGSKNEATVYIRGFDIRSIPVYIDGIPVYTTYDGYVDLGRFLTFDYAVISASKGFSPMEFGPNTIGGAINLVSLKPVNKINVQASTGFASGNQKDYGINFGSRLKKFYFQGSFLNHQSDFFPLSSKYPANNFEDGNKRENSYSNDQKINLKAGFTPNKNHEYSFNFINQQGEKGNPPYSGNDENIRTRFWQWPAWNKQSFYFISKNTITKNLAIKTRLYYDEFYNKLESYDDNSYTTQNKPFAFTSIYDDHTFGGNFVLKHAVPSKNNLSFSVHYKNDFHVEYNLGEPKRNFNDVTWSFGLDENLVLNEKLTLKTGLGFNRRQGIEADNFDAKTGEIFSFELARVNAINVQAGADYSINKNNKIVFYVSRRTRFATLKDRYSYRLGRTLPNPELNAESALHNNLTFQSKPAKNLQIESSVFYIRLNNTIQLVDNIEPGISQLQNTGKAHFTGFDIAASYHPNHWVFAEINYSFIERKNIDNPDILFTDVPKNKVWGNLSFSPYKKLEINTQYEFYSQRFSTSYGTTAEAFSIFNAFFSYPVKTFTIFTGVKNMFDKHYEFQEGYAAPGRQLFVRLLFEMNQ